MGRPSKGHLEAQRDRLRTLALVRELSFVEDVANPNQFAELVAVRTGTFQDAAKWRANFKGERCISPQQLQLLTKLDRNVVRQWEDGPWGLWRALWGDPLRDDFQSRIRIRWSDDEPSLPDNQESAEVPFGWLEERTHADCLAALERVVGTANANCQDVLGRYLVEAVLLYRLDAAMSSLAFVASDCYQPYRCIRLCLANPGVRCTLISLGIEREVYLEVASLEYQRLVLDDRYRKAKQLALDFDALWDYAEFGRPDLEDRWGPPSNVSLASIRKLLKTY